MTVNSPDAPRERGKRKPGASPLQTLVEQRIMGSSYTALRQVQCSDHEGVVTLTGRVPKYFLKQMAQSIARSVAGVEEVVNRIVVGGDPSTSSLGPGAVSAKRPESIERIHLNKPLKKGDLV